MLKKRFRIQETMESGPGALLSLNLLKVAQSSALEKMII